MNTWYTIKVKFTKEFTDGTLKRVTEPYLVNSMSFTEAEARIYKEVGEYIRGEFLVTSIAKTDFQDIFQYDDSDVWYKAKVSYVTEDADSGKEKKINHNYLVNAVNIKEAYERIEESLKGLMATIEITNITKTPLMEIYPYDPEFAAENYEMSNEEEEEEIVSPNINVAYAAGDDEDEEEEEIEPEEADINSEEE
ncbi:DUF4494 domain-containing protein [Paracrocinitomix mangrovi]|uniref:DUF4494 domain-containing protein n=1 Tax=Paracrocinitomix mangrovi TaxID=2862509 RepID=UPI001C8E5B19|nr:DUF4494 domain-containing protein [Paracrocinitomix mangrovi]UKN02581.1 DUF4494 domain-containing protein [Paracrocinitomix mangrovi]